MSHFALLWKARTIEKYRQRYEDEKINSIVLSNANIPEKTLFKKWKHYRNDMKKHLSRTFSKWYPEGTTVSNFLINFGDMKFPHILLRSAVGFLGGLILTYLCFVFFVFQLSISLVNATVLSSFIGVLLTLGLTLSNRMRCLVFLLIPQLFSRVGRYTLTCYALVLILTGPATNTLKNSEVLSESMACSQEQIKLSVSQINESVKKPFNSIKDALYLMIHKMKDITWKLKVALVKTNRALITLASIIQSNFFWLDTIAKRCNAELGTPYERCSKFIAKIAENSPKISKGAGNDILMELGKPACEYLSFYKKFCVAPDFVETTFLATIRGKLKIFTDRIKSMLFIHIKIQHSYTFIGNTSRTPSQVAAGIVTEIRNRADPIFTWLSWSSCVTSLFLLLIIFRAKHYQHMYETRSRFDNRYITKEFRELDLKRLRENRQTVLPLNRRERAKYVTTTSFRLVASEKVYLNRSAMFMMITTFKLLIHIVADYSLYWVLVTIRYHGNLQSVLTPGIPESGVHVIGQGFVARFLKSLLQTLDIPLLFIPPSHNTCLPKPYPPDFKRYGQIGILILLLWLFALFEPYGLRMRHLIMGHYRPERARARAVWLYNHILRTRGSFMKFARRKLHREYKYSSYRKMTFRHWLISFFPQWQLNLLGLKLGEAKCLLCNITKESNDYTEFIRCYGRNCPGTYCESCFNDIGRMCTICMSPLDYGDQSDISLERGSSSEDSDDDISKDKAGPSIRTNTSNSSPDLEPGPGFDESDMDECDSIYGTNFRDSYDAFPLIRRYMRNTNHVTSKNNMDDINYDPVNNKINNLNAKGMSDKCLKTTKIIVTNITEKLSQVTKKGLNTTAVFQCWYSFYEMNIIGNQLFAVRRVISLNNKIRCRKSGSKKPITVLKGNDKTTKNNDKNKNKEVTSPSKPEKGNYNCTDNDAQLHEDTKDKKKKKCKKKKNSIDIDSKSNTIRTNYMKYIFGHLIPCTEFTSNTNEKLESNRSPTLSVKKKKRKRKKSNASPKPLAKAKHNPLESRNYRISSYLAELEWVKNKFEKKRLKNDTSLNVGVESKPAKVDMPFEQNESHIKIYDVMIPKLKLNFSNESIHKDEEIQTQNQQSSSYLNKIRQYVQSNTEYAKVAVDRYFRRMNYTSDSFNMSRSSIEVANHNIEEYEVQNNLLSNYEYNIPRAMKYFDSIHKNMDDYRDDTHYVPSLDFNSSSEYSDFQRNMSFNDVTSKEIQGNLIRQVRKNDPKLSSDEMSATGWNRLKRAFSGRLPELGGQQKDLPSPGLTNRSAQICHKRKSLTKPKPEVMNCDIQVNNVVSTCTCATQYYTENRDVGTYKHFGLPGVSVGTPKDATSKEIDTTDTGTGTTDTTTFSRRSTISFSTDSLFTVLSETSKTDTTICSLAQIEYTDSNRKRKSRSKAVTKANQSTLTDQAKFCDVSTVTDDWWSPIIERKVDIDFSRHNIERISRIERKSRELRNRGLTAGGRIVKFRSHAQIIPRESIAVNDDILSPTRYLLESQKYYNELFSSRFYSPHVLTMADLQNQHQKADKMTGKGNKRSHYRLNTSKGLLKYPPIIIVLFVVFFLMT